MSQVEPKGAQPNEVQHYIYRVRESVHDVINVNLDTMSEEAQNLLFSALLLPEVLEDAFNSRQVQKVTEYLKNLAASLHKFYNENRVVGSVEED